MGSYSEFEALHKDQLVTSGVPQTLWKKLHDKLTGECFDIGSKVSLAENPDSDSAFPYRLVLTADCLKKEEDVFLIDHAWTTSLEDGVKQLESVPGLLDRVESITKTDNTKPTPLEESDDEEFDHGDVELVMSQADVSKQRANELLREHNGEVIEAILNANKQEEEENDTMAGIKKQILGQMEGDSSEDRSSWHTERYSCEQSDQEQTINVIVPMGQKPSAKDAMCTIEPTKLRLEVFGKEIIDDDLCGRVKPDDSLWTIEGQEIRITLTKASDEQWSGLTRNEVRVDPKAKKRRAEAAFSKLWRQLQAYEFARGTRENAIVRAVAWYLMDEVGSAISHGDSQNCICVPFLYVRSGGPIVPFSIVWPCADINEGDVLTRDFCPRWMSNPSIRSAYLYAINPHNPTNYIASYNKLEERLSIVAKELKDTAAPPAKSDVFVPQEAPSVYINTPSVRSDSWLKESQFYLSDKPEKADVVFQNRHDSSIAITSGLSNVHPLSTGPFSSPAAFVSFINTSVGSHPWINTQFHLPTQLPEFIGSSLLNHHSYWHVTDGTDSQIGTEKPGILTSDPSCVIRHLDIGYTIAKQYIPSALHHVEQYLIEYIVLVDQAGSLWLFNEKWASYWRTPLENGKPSHYNVIPQKMEMPLEQIYTQVKSESKDMICNAHKSILFIIKSVFAIALESVKGRSADKKFGLFKVDIGLKNASISPDGASGHPQPFLDNITSIDGQKLPDFGSLMSSVIDVLTRNDAQVTSKWTQIF
ncbi:hypothetical protein H4219_005686 [Mycoemilia scoparia]|uniref:CS domain-containing protein n=1 Tax=Mycoemilia scoparia TaxID=417184 RepID=A0A9W7ZNE7_9FUNG|nr:hypothetical protein H4219_005686 [Mycoemilia scoparia]